MILIIAPIAMAFAGPLQSIATNGQEMHMWSVTEDSSASLDVLSYHSSNLEAGNAAHQGPSCADQCEHCDYCHGATVRLRIVALPMISSSPLSSFAPMMSIDIEVDIKPPKPPIYLSIG